MKKLLTVLLAWCLVVLPCTISLADENKSEILISGDWRYMIQDDGTAAITGYNDSEKKVVVPEELDGKKVTSIRGWGSWYTSTVSITIPDSITSFEGNPFAECSRLNEFIVSPDHPTLAVIDGVLFCKSDKRLICFPSAIKTAYYEIPNGIKIIGESAFQSSVSLNGITIPDSVTCIEGKAFAYCENLTSITIPDSVTNIVGNPFCDCRTLDEIIVSSSHPYLEVIDGLLFSKPDKRLIYCPHTFKTQDYSIPEGTETIGDYAFYRCGNVRGVTIPDSVTYIGDSAFESSGLLNEIIIPNNVTYIGNGAFCFCNMLTHVTIPDGVTNIEDNTFMSCFTLSEVTIPNSVTNIGERAFSGSQSLNSITIPDSVTTIGAGAFNGCDSLTLTVSRDSYALQYCKENGIKYTYPDSNNDWLND